MAGRRINVWANIDWITVVLYLILIIMGWFNIYAAVYNEQHHMYFDLSTRYTRQFIFILLAFLIGLSALFIEVNFYTFFSYAIYAVAVLFLIAVLFVGKEINGARSWFSFGWFNIQPSEFAKVATCMALAKYYSSFSLKTDSLKTLVTAGTIILFPAFLILMQPDAGSAIVFMMFLLPMFREGMPGAILVACILVAVLFFVSLIVDKQVILLGLIGLAFISHYLIRKNGKETFISIFIWLGITGIGWLANYLFRLNIERYHILLAGTLLAGGVYVVLALRSKLRKVFTILLIFYGAIAFTFSIGYVLDKVLNEHQRQRVNIMLNLEQDPQGVGYNVNQSKIAIGSGGFFGKGFLSGTQNKGDFVPEQSTDFIFCTVGEEWGFAGSLVVLIVFIGLVLRIIYLAEKQRSVYSRVFGYGLASVFFAHIAVNIGMTIGLLPVIGIPLPFFSYGGSSLWAFTLFLFIFLRLDASRLEVVR